MKIDYERFFNMDANMNFVLNKQAQYVKINDAICRKLGYSREELLGMPITELIHPDDFENTMTKFAAVLQGQTVLSVESLFTSKNGTNIYFDTNAVLDLTTDLLYLTTTDITDLRKITNLLEAEANASIATLTKTVEELLDTNRKLEEQNIEYLVIQGALIENEKKVKAALNAAIELNELRSKFITVASHEFRTPLSTILSSNALLGRYKLDHQQKNRDKHIARIKTSVKILESILSDFLILSKLEEGIIELNPIFFHFNEFLDTEIRNKLAPIFKDGQQVDITYKGKTVLFLDQKMLRYILIHLTSNAIKFSNYGDPVKIICRHEQNKLHISVIDQGIGIPPKEIHRIFEYFYRAENVVNIQGTGIGLNIVQQFVELMKGKIQIFSTLGEGTTIKLTFPVDEIQQ